MAIALKILRSIAAVIAGLAYWYGSAYLGAMIGGAGHGYLLFFGLVQFPADYGLLLYAVTGLLLAFPKKKFNKMTVGFILCIQYGYTIWFLSVDGWESVVHAWERSPGDILMNSLWVMLGHALAWWLILRKAKPGS